MSTYTPSPRTKQWILAFGFWTLLALSYALSAGLSQISEGNPPTWDRMVIWNLTNFWLWMLLVPAVAWLGRSTANLGWGRFCLVHIPASLLLALVQAVVRISVFWALCGPRQPTVHTLGQYLEGEFVGNFHLSVLTYWIVLAVLRGMESRRHLQNERLRNARLETQLVQSQLQALRMQLRPHFLFNTLNAISALALKEPMRARRMIARLSDLLRLTLEQRHSQLVSLSRELEFVRSYLSIQQERFHDRLETEFDVTDDSLHAEVPSMILQPLVENALRHGLLAKPTSGNLRIIARREGEYLNLAVEDDGLGPPADGGKEGVGLGATRERLRVMFEDAASLHMHEREGGGTRVELRMPFRAAATAGAA
ncbi:MAG TPA: histidine kinase [Rhodanobacteraceae bacterium]|nr:histidine kinase [Rhodanobacteraceae bacterium]